jgi:hypothetical protein
MPPSLTDLKTLLKDIDTFTLALSGLKLRSYQREAARAVCNSIFEHLGLSIVIMFPRQSGKNELQAQLEAFLLALMQGSNAEIVKVSPTWKPQSLNAMRRLERTLDNNIYTHGRWVKESGYIYRLGKARVSFLSGAPTSNIVGATASTLLECDEAQDVLIDKWDKEINPMAASTNATRVFWGTAWTSQTLLARELRTAQLLSAHDGIQRVFRADANTVAAEAPAYGAFVANEVARLGASHPSVRSQYYSQEIDQEGGMFPPARRALMQGRHAWLDTPLQLPPAELGGGRSLRRGSGAGSVYAFLIDVGGEDEAVAGAPAGQASFFSELHLDHDATALTIVAVDLSGLSDPVIAAPCYRVVHRRQWTGSGQAALYAQIKALAELWQPRHIVIDATGIGAGLASFLENALGGRGSGGRSSSPGGGPVIPFVFSQKSKSELGWDFLAVIETGRYQEYLPQSPVGVEGEIQRKFFRQLEFCQMEVLPGPSRTLHWGVPDGARDPASGEPLHDDLVISAALCTVLERLPWGQAHSVVIQGYDPLDHLKEF